jgi:hypothetical protein
MKHLLLLLAVASLSLKATAQLELKRIYTPANTTSYMELVNNSRSPVALNCYSIVLYNNADSGALIRVFLLPLKTLDANGLLSIGAESSTYNPISNHLHLNFSSLATDGLVQTYLLDRPGSQFVKTTDSTANRLTEEMQAPFVLLFNGNNLVDAVYAADAEGRLPNELLKFPALSYTNACGSLVSVQFNGLENRFPLVFKKAHANNDYGYFKEFQVHRNNATAQIAWKTAREQNDGRFEVQRRSGTAPWTTVAYVATRTPAGNSSQTIDYLYGDDELPAGNVQYRLKQINQNGRSMYSRPMDAISNNKNFVLYPNPATGGTVNLSFNNVNALRDVALLSQNGQVLQQWLSVNNSQQQINDLQRGQYYVRVLNRQTGELKTEKLIVQ